MQILKIRGENLASLAGYFEIDLTEEPLRSAGLFAITGQTGAGKSSLLDAMCLGLYGMCPRLSAEGVNDDVPDISGEILKSSDARTTLRRGESSGFAEVTFIAPDGITYKASWAVRRARGRAEGRLQNVERALIRADDGTVLESQINAVKERVTEIMGLTYDEFRRTVLLAQGDFDAFLRANTAERAALLEKVTGTSVYREISRRIYARHDAAKKALAEIETRQSAIPVMGPEEREALNVERQALGLEIKSLEPAIARIAEELAKVEAHKASLLKLEEARKAVKEAEATLDAALPDETTAKEIRAALELKPEVQAVDAGIKATERLAREHEEIRARAEKAEARLKVAQEALRKAEEAHTQAEAEFKRLGPEWTRAEQLDARVGAAKTEEKEAEDLWAEAAKATVKVKETLADLETSMAAGRAKKAEAEAQVARLPTAGRLADRWDEALPMIDQRRDAKAALQTMETSLANVKSTLKASEADLLVIEKEDETAKKTLEEIEGDLSGKREDLKNLKEGDASGRMERLRAGEDALKDMRRAATDWMLHCKLRDGGAQKLSEGKRSLEKVEADIGRLEKDIPRLEGSVTALEAPLDRAEAASSAAASRLRASLEDGKPCPVCGSCDHTSLEDTALAEQARALRADLDAARKALAEARAALQTARIEKSALQDQISKSTIARDEAQAAMDLQEASYEAARQIAAETGLQGLTTDMRAAPEQLSGLFERLSVRRAEIQALIGAEAKATKEIEDMIRRLETLRGEQKKRDDRRRAAEQTVSSAKTSEARLEAELTSAAGGIASLDQRLTPLLEAVRKTPACLDQDCEGMKLKLSRVVSWWQKTQDDLLAAEKTLVATAPLLASAEAEVKSSARAEDQAKKVVEARALALSGLIEERKALLGGEATETHRSRHNTARLNAAKGREDASAGVGSIKAELGGISGAMATTEQSRIAATSELSSARKILSEACKRINLEEAVARSMIEKGAAAAEAIETRLKTLRETVSSTQGELRSREGDLAALVEKGLPQTEEDALRTSKDTHQKSLEAAREKVGAIAGKIEADDKMRAKRAALGAEAREAKEAADVWLAVNEAVGSRQGGKFAQIAQAVTLGLLVERANVHLSDLKPRYRLLQGGEDLSLHIVDQDMGGEVRSTRSMSGGERFLVSLALALALSGMGSRGAIAATLFIDEGFGSLDAEDLEMAIDALETLQAQGRTIGVISHVEAMKDRIPVQIRVTKRGGGASFLQVAA